ncbi:MAG: pre-peptidase C-terminal domain-containing protein [Planctomycetaceae bacterium]|nr:pre-peptidase C-terminal domain-containing protein [Planctomycetaceae bacterium]
MTKTLLILLASAGTFTVAALAEETPAPVPLPAAQPVLLAVTPSGLQQGTSVDVTVQGRSLLPVSAVSVDGRGITAEVIPPPEGSRPNANVVKVRLTATADAEPGIHELRVATPAGSSNVTRFVVGMLPEVIETEPNNDDGTSMRISSLPVTVNGSLDRTEDRDCFRFSAKQGQVLVFDFCGQQMHPYIDGLRPGWLEGVVIIRDAAVISPIADQNLAALAVLNDRTSASQRASSIARSRSESAQKANADRNTAAKETAELKAAAEKATAVAQQTQTAAEQADAALNEAKQTAESVAAGETGDSDKSQAEQLVVEKTAAAQEARKAADDAQAAATKAAAALTDAEKKLASLTASAVTLSERSAKAAEESRAAGSELAAARTLAAEVASAVKAATNPSVRNLAIAARSPGRYDPLLTFTVPRDGDYLVEVRDDLYRGRAEFTYRLTIGELPLITHVFPAGVQRGTETTVQIGGVNLGDTTAMTVAIPADAPADPFEQHVTTAVGPSNRVAVIPGDAAEILETEPNDAAEQATMVSVPGTMNGVISQNGDFDHYRFTAVKGQRLILETVSRAFGSPLDARLDLYDARGRRLKASDDENRLPDSRIDYTFTEDGEYVVAVGDTTGTGSNRHVYRLVAREAQPDFRLTVNPDAPRVTAGGSVAISVMIERLDGFDADVEISVPQLPAGASVSPAIISQSQSQVTLSLTMASDAQPATVPMGIQGRAVLNDTEIVHAAAPVERMRYINEWRYVPVADLQLTVMGPAPYTLEWGQADLTVAAGSNQEVPLKLHRTPGFTDAVRITLQGLPSRLTAPVVTFDADATEAIVQVRAAGNASVGTGNAVATGTVRGFAQDSPALAINVTKKAE